MRWLTAKYWSGSMNVASMRMHSSLQAAKKRMEQLVKEERFLSMTRCYEFNGTDSPPRNITNKMGLKGEEI